MKEQELKIEQATGQDQTALEELVAEELDAVGGGAFPFIQ